MNIYVGNLHPQTTEEMLRGMFKEFGKIMSVKIITDMETGLCKGFGFVDMDDNNDGHTAIKNLNGNEFMGQAIEVSEAMAVPQTENKYIKSILDKKAGMQSGANKKK